jgi:hypothetical protein
MGKVDRLPWENRAEQWNPDWWYPLPIGALWVPNAKVYFIEGYRIFQQDKEFPEDILPVGDFPVMTFETAVRICEAHNGKQLSFEYSEWGEI